MFTIYTDDCRSESDNINIIKFADDTAIQCLMKENTTINDTEIYKNQIFNFASWCKNHFLQLNVSKTKEMIVDFRKSNFNHEKIFIEGQEVEVVENYKYLGIKM